MAPWPLPPLQSQAPLSSSPKSSLQVDQCSKGIYQYIFVKEGEGEGGEGVRGEEEKQKEERKGERGISFCFYFLDIEILTNFPFFPFHLSFLLSSSLSFSLSQIAWLNCLLNDLCLISFKNKIIIL